MNEFEAGLRWWLAFAFVAVAFAPLVWWMAAGLGRFRHAFIRPVGLVLATFIVWWPAALFGIPFRTESLVVGSAAVGACGWFLTFRYRRDNLRDLRSLAVIEVLWLAGFAGYLLFRAQNPDIANTEKPMEIALLSAVVNATDVPAPDPWYAGSPINYYYFGYQSVASLIHLSGVQATVAFNLMLGSLFASTLTGAAGLGGWLTERVMPGRLTIWASAALSAFFVALAGNLETFKRLLQAPGETVAAGWWDGVGWQASRVITDSGVNGNPATVETINEFPAFSFVLGDLHPHLTTLPVLLATIALAAGVAAEEKFGSYWRVGAVGAFAGLLYASNSWDAPVGLLVVCGAVVMASRRVNRTVFFRCATALVGAGLAAMPFMLAYTAPVGVSTNDVPAWFARVPVLGTLPDTIAIVTWRPSSMGEVLTVHGIWIACGGLFAGWFVATSPPLRALLHRRLTIIAPLGLVLLAVALAWAPALILLGLPALTLLAAAIVDSRAPLRIAAGILSCGFGLALIPEFFYIQDSFGSRMNTVFKLNFQAWLFLAVGSAVALIIVAAGSEPRIRAVGVALIALATVVAAPYAILSAEDWMDMGIASGTLDGAAYLEIVNPAEDRAINWLAAHTDSGDVIVEAPGCAYQSINGVPMNRFSAFTGVPTLLGWANHERQWRRGEFSDLSKTIGSRDALANSWLEGQPGPTTKRIEPRFVVFGVIEQSMSDRCPMLVQRGDAEIEALMDQGWRIAFADGATTILAREGDAALAAEPLDDLER